MKCRVCGNELEPGKTVCEVCGTRQRTVLPMDEDFSWNTVDFPKPKKPVDIEMNWGEFDTARKRSSYMNSDASEGFVNAAGQGSGRREAPAAPETPQQREVPAYTAPRHEQTAQPRMPQETYAPPQPEAPVYTAPPQPQAQQPRQTPNLAWTMPSSVWTAPPQQTVYIPPAYGQPVYVQQPQPAAPVQPAQPVYVQPQPVYQAPLTSSIPPLTYTIPPLTYTIPPQPAVWYT